MSSEYKQGKVYTVTAWSAGVTVSINGVTFFSLNQGEQRSFVYPAAGDEVTITGTHEVTRSDFSAALSSSAGGGGSAYSMPQRIKQIPDSYTNFQPEMLILESNCATVLNLNGGAKDFTQLDVIKSGDGVQEAELWVVVHDPTSLQWAEDLIWADGQTAPPTLTLLHLYVFSVRKHYENGNENLIINLAYSLKTLNG